MSKYDPPPYTPGFNDPSHHAPPPPTTQTVIVTQVVSPLGDGPTSMTCPYCHANIVTTVSPEPNTKTHLFALLLCLVFWPCVCVPYCVDSCQSKKHTCPNCKAYLGTFSD